MALNLIDYEISKRLSAADLPFQALIAAAIRKADTEHLMALRRIFPELFDDLQKRYSAPGGLLPGDTSGSPERYIEQARDVASQYLSLVNP